MPSLPNPHAPQQSTRALIDPTRVPQIEAAYHEAGHAAAALALGVPFDHVSILPCGQGYGHIRLAPPRDPRDYLTFVMAGLAGVIVGLGTPALWRNATADDARNGAALTGGVGDDLRAARLLVAALPDAQMVTLLDVDPLGDVADTERDAWRGAARQQVIVAAGVRASDLLREPVIGRGLQSLATELLRRQWLPYAAARAAFAGESGALSRHHNWTETGRAASLIS